MKRMLQCLVGCVLAGSGVVFGATPDPVIFDAGFLASRWVDVNGDTRTRVLGPLFEFASSPEGKTLLAFRPLYNRAIDPQDERENHEYLWPIASSKQLKKEYNFRFAVAYYQDSDTTDPMAPYHLWAFPFYFQGRDAQTNRYAALFPLGGQIRNFLTFDKINFALFPLWAQATKMQNTNFNLLWPVYLNSKGGGTERWRIWPLYGHSSYRGGYEHGFVAWPIYNWVRESKPGMAGFGYIVFPLWGHVDSELIKTWYVLPPFIRFSKGKDGERVHCPWPFFQWSEGETDQLTFFPLWGVRTFGNIHNSFVLWPLVRYQRTERATATKERLVVLPFSMSEKFTSTATNSTAPTGVVARYHMIWPLASYRREGASKRFRCLELWPLKNTGPIERSYSPLWTLYTHTTTPAGTEDEVLWGLYRHQKRGEAYRYSSLFPFYSWERNSGEEDRREWNVLKGLIGVERKGKERTLRLLFFMKFKWGEAQP